MQAVCQMIVFGDQEFEKMLLQLNNGDQDPAADARAFAVLNMFCLDRTGESDKSHVRPSHTAQIPHSTLTTNLCSRHMWLQHACLHALGPL